MLASIVLDFCFVLLNCLRITCHFIWGEGGRTPITKGTVPLGTLSQMERFMVHTRGHSAEPIGSNQETHSKKGWGGLLADS